MTQTPTVSQRDTSVPEPAPVTGRPVSVYIAARGEDQQLAVYVRKVLAEAGIVSTARWIDHVLGDDCHDMAQVDIDDLRAAEAVVVIKVAESHRHTTGGHHVETGMALERGMPIILLGERENVFHHHNRVHVVPWIFGEMFSELDLEMSIRVAVLRARELASPPLVDGAIRSDEDWGPSSGSMVDAAAHRKQQ